MKHVLIFIGIFILYQASASLLVEYAIIPFLPHTNYDPIVLSIFLSTILYSIMTLATFIGAKWCNVSSKYILSKPYEVLSLVALLSLSFILPSTWTQELIPEQWRIDIYADIFDKLSRYPEGYIVIGLCAPLVEEVVFRGAILRKLLEWIKDSLGELSNKKAWIAIVISAVFFAAIHGNPAQIPHALIIGILLGWLYYRTGSIIPGVIYHWINNSVAYFLTWIFPDIKSDAPLSTYFNGNENIMITSVIVSSIIAIACIWQLNHMIKET